MELDAPTLTVICGIVIVLIGAILLRRTRKSEEAERNYWREYFDQKK